MEVAEEVTMSRRRSMGVGRGSRAKAYRKVTPLLVSMSNRCRFLNFPDEASSADSCADLCLDMDLYTAAMTAGAPWKCAEDESGRLRGAEWKFDRPRNLQASRELAGCHPLPEGHWG